MSSFTSRCFGLIFGLLVIMLLSSPAGAQVDHWFSVGHDH